MAAAGGAGAGGDVEADLAAKFERQVKVAVAAAVAEAEEKARAEIAAAVAAAAAAAVAAVEEKAQAHTAAALAEAAAAAQADRAAAVAEAAAAAAAEATAVATAAAESKARVAKRWVAVELGLVEWCKAAEGSTAGRASAAYSVSDESNPSAAVTRLDGVRVDVPGVAALDAAMVRHRDLLPTIADCVLTGDLPAKAAALAANSPRHGRPAGDGVTVGEVVHALVVALSSAVSDTVGDSAGGSWAREQEATCYHRDLYQVERLLSRVDHAHIRHPHTQFDIVHVDFSIEDSAEWTIAMGKGVTQARAAGSTRLLYAMKMQDPQFGTATGIYRAAYSAVTDGFTLAIVKVWIDEAGANGPTLRCDVSPPQPLWPAAIMEAAYAGRSGANKPVFGAKPAVVLPAAAVAAAAASMVVPQALLMLAAMMLADRNDLGTPPCIPRTGLHFYTPPADDLGAAVPAKWASPLDVDTGTWPVLGAGSFSDAFAVTAAGSPAVLKAIRHPKPGGCLLDEAAALLKLRDAPVPRVVGGAWMDLDGNNLLVALVLRPVGVTLPAAVNALGDDKLARFALVVRAMCVVLEALKAAHAVSMAHGDVRAPNVIVAPDGSVVLSDWGCAHLRSARYEVRRRDVWGCARLLMMAPASLAVDAAVAELGEMYPTAAPALSAFFATALSFLSPDDGVSDGVWLDSDGAHDTERESFLEDVATLEAALHALRATVDAIVAAKEAAAAAPS